MKKISFLLLVVILTYSCQEKPKEEIKEVVKESPRQVFKQKAIQIMNFYSAEIGWEKKAKTTIAFANQITKKTVAMTGRVKDLYYENGSPYAAIYDSGTGSNDFLAYVKLSEGQLNILSKIDKARGYFAVHVDGILSGKPDFTNSNEMRTAYPTIKMQGEMVGFCLEE